MSSPAMICNLEYRMTEFNKGRLTSQQAKMKINTQDMYKYYDRDDACDKTICTKDAFDYYDYRVGSTGGFDGRGAVDVDKSTEYVKQYKPKIMYRMVLSFTDDFASEHNLKPKKNMQQLIQKSMNKNLIDMGFDPDNVMWSAYYHTNTKSPHVHIAFYEKKATRKNPIVQKKRFVKVRSNIYKNISHNIEIYVNRDDIKKRLINEVKKWNISEEMKKRVNESLNNHKTTFSCDHNLINHILKLEKELPKNGSMKYNSSNIRPYHQQIKEIVNEILEDDNVNKFYQKYLEQLNKEMELQDSIYGSGDKEYVGVDGEVKKGVGEGRELQENFKKNKVFEIETQMANMLLQNILMFRKDMNIVPEGNVPPSGTFNEEDVPEEQASKNKGIRKQKRNIKTRHTIMKHGTVQEIAHAIEESFYSQQRMKQMQQEVINKAQEEIRSRTL